MRTSNGRLRRAAAPKRRARHPPGARTDAWCHDPPAPRALPAARPRPYLSTGRGLTTYLPSEPHPSRRHPARPRPLREAEQPSRRRRGHGSFALDPSIRGPRRSAGWRRTHGASHREIVEIPLSARWRAARLTPTPTRISSSCRRDGLAFRDRLPRYKAFEPGVPWRDGVPLEDPRASCPRASLRPAVTTASPLCTKTEGRMS